MDDDPAMSDDADALRRWPVRLYDPPPLGWMNTLAVMLAVGGALALTGGMGGGGGHAFGSAVFSVGAVLGIFAFGMIYGPLYVLFRFIRGSTRSGDAVVGTDGILCVDRFVGWDEIDRVETTPGSVKLHAGGRQTRFFTDAADEIAATARARIDAIVARAATPVPHPLRPARAESYVERSARLQDLRSSGYRELGVRPESLLAVLSDPRISEDDRTAAAIVLSSAPERIRQRAQPIIASLANADLRFTLDAALREPDSPKVRVADDDEPELAPMTEPVEAATEQA